MSESRLSPQQRASVVALFEQGYGRKSAARVLGLPVQSVATLHSRWRVVGQAVLVTNKTPRRYDADLKREVVERFLAGQTRTDLAVEFGLSSPRIIRKWVAIYRD